MTDPFTNPADPCGTCGVSLAYHDNRRTCRDPKPLMDTKPSVDMKQGIKLDTGKPPLDLVEAHFIEDVGRVLLFGADKYSPNNWQKGMSLGKCLAGVLRHTYAMLRGEHLDPETGLSHAAHAACGLMFAHYYIRNGMLSVPDDRFGKGFV